MHMYDAALHLRLNSLFSQYNVPNYASFFKSGLAITLGECQLVVVAIVVIADGPQVIGVVVIEDRGPY